MYIKDTPLLRFKKGGNSSLIITSTADEVRARDVVGGGWEHQWQGEH